MGRFALKVVARSSFKDPADRGDDDCDDGKDDALDEEAENDAVERSNCFGALTGSLHEDSGKVVTMHVCPPLEAELVSHNSRSPDINKIGH